MKPLQRIKINIKVFIFDIECDQNLKYDTFDDETNCNINISRKRLERELRKKLNNHLYCLTLTQNNIYLRILLLPQAN